MDEEALVYAIGKAYGTWWKAYETQWIYFGAFPIEVSSFQHVPHKFQMGYCMISSHRKLTWLMHE
jgi:hypothetical protein